jgi:hypothetical protein
MVVEPSLQDDSEFLYAAQPELLQYRTPQLTVEKVMAWYQSRAEDIEHHAGQVSRGGTVLSGVGGASWSGSSPSGQESGARILRCNF